jgi:hypothetical protein
MNASIMTKSIVLTTAIACTLSSATAFTPTPPLISINRQTKKPARQQRQPQTLSFSTNNEFDDFNPFQPGSKLSSNSSKSGILTIGKQSSNVTPGGQISPRAMKMAELTSTLLNSISDDIATHEILLQNEHFLLEQFNNVDCVLEEGSIFTPDMSREERFKRYRLVMGERIDKARVPAARGVLCKLMEFVLSRE